MADSAHIAQVTARQIPVTIQGSQIVEGTERRELFTESLKTALIFDNGAAVNLKARVARGQSLFLRNELSGREILCRVIESPPPGQIGCTDLEFTIHDPEFWSARPEPAADAADNSEAQQQEEKPATAESATAAPTVESPGEASAPPPEAVPLTVPRGQEIPGFSALLPQAEAPAGPASVSQVDDARDAEQLAGIIAKYARAIAKRASAKTAANEAQQQLASNAAPQDETNSAPTRRQKAFSTLAFRLHAIRELTVKNNPIALGIVACVVIGAALGVAWDVTGMLYPAGRPLAGIVRMKPRTPHVKAGPSTTASAKAGTDKAKPARAARIQPPAVAQVPAERIEKSPAATTTDVSATRVRKAAEDLAAPLAYTIETNGSTLNSDQEVPGQERRRKGDVGPQEMIPAKIVSQYQPYLPPWAKNLDVDGVVKLDAVIDEKGNLKAMKLLSGPRALESAAEGAVGLWLFAPALSDGKPTATHIILTVEFQR
jgi:periplasmic protein TonB